MKAINITPFQIILCTLSALILVVQSMHVFAGNPPENETIPRWKKRNYLTMGWTSAVPLWHTLDQSAGYSPAGASLAFQFRITQRISVGPEISWQLFDGIPGQTEIDANGNTSTDANIVNGLNIKTWLERRFLYTGLSFHFYPTSKRDTMLPYIGLSAGAMRVREKQGITPFTDASYKAWHFATIPEIGIYLLHGRIPVWLCTRLFTGFPTESHDGEMFMAFTLGVATPN